MSDEDIEKWAHGSRKKETARTKTKAPRRKKVNKRVPVPIDSSDEDDEYTDGELEQALIKIGLLKISDGKMMFTADIPPFGPEAGGIFIAQVIDEAEGEPPRKKRKHNSDPISDNMNADMSDDTNNQTNDQINDQTINEINDQTIDETNDQTIDETKDQTDDQTINETKDQTDNQTIDETDDQTIDETDDQPVDDTITRACERAMEKRSHEAFDEILKLFSQGQGSKVKGQAIDQANDQSVTNQSICGNTEHEREMATRSQNIFDELIMEVKKQVKEQAINQAIDQAIDKAMEQAFNQADDQTIDEANDHTIDPTIDQTIDQTINQTNKPE